MIEPVVTVGTSHRESSGRRHPTPCPQRLLQLHQKVASWQRGQARAFGSASRPSALPQCSALAHFLQPKLSPCPSHCGLQNTSGDNMQMILKCRENEAETLKLHFSNFLVLGSLYCLKNYRGLQKLMFMLVICIILTSLTKN